MPKLSLSQLGFPHTTLQDDIDIAKDLALDGIGLIGALCVVVIFAFFKLVSALIKLLQLIQDVIDSVEK